MSKPMMKCGHTANATYNDGKPCCIICLGIDPGATQIANTMPDLIYRMARCGYCGDTTPSSTNLPFFEYKPKQEYDSYYCGCGGRD